MLYLLSAVLLIACIASFSWGMRTFFYKPSGDSAGMKMIRLCGTLFTALHLAAILATPDVSARQIASGALLYASSLGLFFWALRANGQRSLSAAFSPDRPQHLVDWGPYRFVRHPFYCSYLLTWLAGYVATGRWWVLPTAVVMTLVYRHAANQEEAKFAASPLGALYREYQKSTGQFLPNPLALVRARRKESNEASLA